MLETLTTLRSLAVEVDLSSSAFGLNLGQHVARSLAVFGTWRPCPKAFACRLASDIRCASVVLHIHASAEQSPANYKYTSETLNQIQHDVS